MNRQEFVDALRQKLLLAGFPNEYVSQQCTALQNRLLELPDSTADKYMTDKNLDIIVKKLLAQDGKLAQSSTDVSAPKPSAEKPKPAAAPSRSASVKPAETPSVRPMPIISDSDVEIVEEVSASGHNTKRSKKTHRASEQPSEQYMTCNHPKLLTVLLGILCAPTVLLLLAASFGLFAGVFILLASAILVIVVGIIGIVGAGSVVSVVSLLYGATQVLSDPRYVGLHEIGFGLLVAGATMAASILLYNVAVRLIPFLFQKISILSKLFVKKLTSIAKNAVKGCEQL